MSKLEQRLARQLAAQGNKGSKAMARNILVKRGHAKKDGTLTSEGEARQKLGNAGRAKDRAARGAGRSPSDYTYDKKTNQATLKKGRKDK